MGCVDTCFCLREVATQKRRREQYWDRAALYPGKKVNTSENLRTLKDSSKQLCSTIQQRPTKILKSNLLHESLPISTSFSPILEPRLSALRSVLHTDITTNMHLPSLFVLVVYLSGYLFLLFAAICLACGLYYLVELAEEYTVFTKKLIRISILLLLPLHFLLYLYERFPFFPCLTGFVSHTVYLWLLRSFPFIQPTSTPFVVACLFFLFDNVIWYRYFTSDPELFYRYRVAPVPAMASFFLLVVWLVPCAFFCSLTVNDAVLPSATVPSARGTTVPGPYPQDPLSSHPTQKKRRSRNIIMAAIDTASAALRRALGAPRPLSQDILSAPSSHR